MIRFASALLCATLLAGTSLAQITPRFQGVEILELSAQERAALDQQWAAESTLGLPALPSVSLDSPRESILFADRIPFAPARPLSQSAAGSNPVLRTIVLPSGPGGTGTIKQELFHMQEPSNYDPSGAAVPLVMGYHGFGASANSVLVQSLLEEECEARGWLFVTPTGYDDKLFASNVSQQHVDAVFDWMHDNYNVDPERIYMIGFSMGGGYVTNYAARHRDPNGLMIAAIGTVSAALDWTLLYATSGQVLKDLMEIEQNFGGTPSENPYGYQQASGLHYIPMSFPPLPGDIFELFSMARNSTHVPAYQTFDTGDTLPLIVLENHDLFFLLNQQAPLVEQSIASGTLDNNGQPAAHSWNVLDEVALFDFFEMHTADRFPQDFRAMLDRDGQVSWLDTSRLVEDKFLHLVASADEPARQIDLDEIFGASALTIDVAAAGLGGSEPIRVNLSVMDVSALTVTLTGLATRPSYLLDAITGELIPGVASDPANDALLLDVSGPAELSFDIIQDPDWIDTLTSTPNPVANGNIATVDIDGPVETAAIFLIVAFQEQLYTAKGVNLGALAVPPAAVRLFTNPNPSGDLSLPAAVPADPNLAGLRLPMQSISLNLSNEVLGVSNLWAVLID